MDFYDKNTRKNPFDWSDSSGYKTRSFLVLEKRMVFNTIGYCLGDMSKAASILGVTIEILREKLETYTK
jgi:DNA-binding protein Fis